MRGPFLIVVPVDALSNCEWPRPVKGGVGGVPLMMQSQRFRLVDLTFLRSSPWDLNAYVEEYHV